LIVRENIWKLDIHYIAQCNTTSITVYNTIVLNSKIVLRKSRSIFTIKIITSSQSRQSAYHQTIQKMTNERVVECDYKHKYKKVSHKWISTGMKNVHASIPNLNTPSQYRDSMASSNPVNFIYTGIPPATSDAGSISKSPSLVNL